MRTLFVAALFLLIFSSTGSAQKCADYTFPGKAFAFCMPAGWNVLQSKDSTNIIIELPLSEKKFTSSITLRGEPRTDSRSETALKLINGAFGFAAYKNTRIVKFSDSKLPSGLDSTSLVFFVDVDGEPLGIAYLLVDGPNKTSADFFLVFRRDDMVTGKIMNDAMETLRAK